MRAPAIVLLLACAASADSALDRSVADYAGIKSTGARAGRHGGVFTIQVNLWLPVAHGDIASDGGPIDLQRDLDVGLIKQSWQALAVPLVGGTLGALAALFATKGSPTPEGVLTASAVGSVVLPFFLHPAADVTAQYNFDPFGFRFDGFHYATEGESTLGRPVAFGGATFPAGRTVDSDFNVTQARLTVMWTFLRDTTDDLHVALSLAAGAAWVRYDASIRDAAATGAADASLLLPQAGFYLEVRSKRWVCEVWIAAGGDGTSIWGDARVSAGYAFGDWFSLRGGYRFVYADLDSNGFRWAGYLEGLYFGCGLHF
jgi:hypothetical protein